MTTNRPCLVHLVGSIPLSSREEVFSTAASILGERAKRFPDGEIGVTTGWIMGHHRVFEASDAFEPYEHIERFDPRVRDIKRRRFRLKSSTAPDSLPRIGYADDARAAYQVITDLKHRGVVPSHARLLVAMPTPYDVLNFAVDESDYAKVAPAYEAHMLAELDLILEHVPNHELAIQWDAAHEFEFLATSSRMFHTISREQIVDLLVRLGRHVPEGVELGYHCCYGMFNLKHFVEPRDMTDMVDVMNGVLRALQRPVQFVHMPVPRYRCDKEYFAPLRNLQLHTSTELYLGLIHDADGIDGALARVAVAKTAIPHFGLATECGLGQRSPDNIRQILKIAAGTAARLDHSG